jgi:hypothetical protein
MEEKQKLASGRGGDYKYWERCGMPIKAGIRYGIWGSEISGFWKVSDLKIRPGCEEILCGKFFIIR